MPFNLLGCKFLSVVQGPPGAFSERAATRPSEYEFAFSYMISGDEWSKLLACNLKLAYGGRMTSVPDHLLEKTRLKAKSAETRAESVNCIL